MHGLRDRTHLVILLLLVLVVIALLIILIVLILKVILVEVIKTLLELQSLACLIAGRRLDTRTVVTACSAPKHWQAKPMG